MSCSWCALSFSRVLVLLAGNTGGVESELLGQVLGVCLVLKLTFPGLLSSQP